MTATEPTLPPHASALLEHLRRRGVPITLNDQEIFGIWKSTDLTDLEIMAGLDFLAMTGLVGRSSARTLRCRVWVRD